MKAELEQRVQDRTTDLQQQREQLRVTLASIGDAVIVTDTEGRATFINSVACSLTGWTPEEATGKALSDVFDIVNEQTRKPVENPVDRALQEGVIVGLANHTILIGKDGVERPIEDSAAPIRNAAGEMIGVVLIFRDVTEQRRAEHEVRQSEARKSAVLETALDCIITMDDKGKVVEFNPAAEKTFGYGRAEAIGQELSSLIIPHRMREAHQKGMAHYLETGEGPVLGKRLELSALRSDGTEFPVELAITLIPTDGPPLFTAFLRDISERKRTEEALLEAHRELENRVAERTAELVQANEFLKALLENVQTGVVACDSDGVLTLFNGVTRALHGLPEEPIPPEQWAGRYCLYQPDGKTPMSKEDIPLYRALQGKQVHDAEMVIAPLGVPPRTVLTSGQALFDAYGNKLGAVASMQDITARKQAEAALRQAHDELEGKVEERTEELGRANAALKESQEKLRLLADTIPQLAWMAQPDGHIFWYNRRWYEYTGTTPEQMEGWGWQSVHDPEVLPKVLERWQGSIASGEAFDMVFPLKGANEEFRPFLTRVNPLRDEEGRILYWFGTNTDISDIKRMEEALRDADRRKDEFLATLAHELRNPLAPISNSLQLLKMPQVDAVLAQKAKDIMERQVHQLVRLVDDLLDVSRVTRGKIDLRRQPVQLATVVARAVETAQPLIELQGHRLGISLPPESLRLDADPVRLAQVVGNLLANSAKYTEPNGHIGLTVLREGTEAVLRVRDDGIGIAPDDLPHIFDSFVQVNHAATRSQGGLGIGLTLVKNLVELHNGTVEARSSGLGKGCEFIVRLPLLSQAKNEKAEAESVEPQSSPQLSGHRLLVVDDNQDAATSLAMLLRLQGHEVRVAFSGPEALDLVTDYRPAMIFLDIGMPGMDGYEVACRLRQLPGLEQTILAALTGWGQEEDRRRTTATGFDHHLIKPPEPKVVEGLLAELKRHEVR